MKKVRLFICLSLVMAIQATPENEGRPKRDLHFIKNLVKHAIFGSKNTTGEPRPSFLIKDSLGNYKMVNIPHGYKAIYIKRVPQGIVVHDVPKDSAATIVESYLGTKSTQESLAALEDVKKLIESGIISKNDRIESIFKVPTAIYSENNLNTPNSPFLLNDRSNIDAHGFQKLPVVSEHSEGSFNQIYRPNDPVINEHEEFYSKELHVPGIAASKEFSDRLQITNPDSPFFIPFTSGPPRTSFNTPINDTVAISLDPKVVYHSYKPVLALQPGKGYSYKQIYNDGSGIHYYLNDKKEVIPRVIKNVQSFRPPKFFVESVRPFVTSQQILDKIDISNHPESIPVTFPLPPPVLVPIPPTHPNVHIVHKTPFQHRYSYVQTNFPSPPVAITVPQQQVFINSENNSPLTANKELTPPRPSVENNVNQVKPQIENRFSDITSHLNSDKTLFNSESTFIKPQLNGEVITNNPTGSQISGQFEQIIPEENIHFNANKQSNLAPVTFISPPHAVSKVPAQSQPNFKIVHNAPFPHKYSYVQTNFPNPPTTINVHENQVQVNTDTSTTVETSPKPFVQHIPLEPTKPFKEIIHNTPFPHKYSYVQTNFPNPAPSNLQQNQIQVNSDIPAVVETSSVPFPQHIPSEHLQSFKTILQNTPFPQHKYSYVQTYFPNPPPTILQQNQVQVNSDVPAVVETSPETFPHKYSYVQTYFPNRPTTINQVQQNQVEENSDIPATVESSPEPFIQYIPSESIKPFKEIVHNNPFPHKYSYVQTNIPNSPKAINFQQNVNSYQTAILHNSTPEHLPLQPPKPFKEAEIKNPETTQYSLNSIDSLPNSNAYYKPEINVVNNQVVQPQFDFTAHQINKENIQNPQTNQYSYIQTHANGNNVIYNNHEVIINENLPVTTSADNSEQVLPEITSSKFTNTSNNPSLSDKEIFNKFSDNTELEVTTEVTTQAPNFNLPKTSTSVTFSTSRVPVKRRKIYRRVNVRRNGTRPYPPKIESLSEKPIVVLPEEKLSEGSFSYKQINNDGSSRTIRVDEDEKSVVVDVNHDVESERGDVPL